MEENNSFSSLSEKIISSCENKENFRCLKCHIIPSINLISNTEDNEIYIKTECSYNHSEIIQLNKYFSYRFNEINLRCKYCKSLNNTIKNIYYCENCNDYICKHCQSHKNEHPKDHLNIIKLNKIDNNCIEHDSQFIGFCKKCRKNICFVCLKNSHFEHENISFVDLQIKKSEIEEYFNQIKIYENFFENISNKKNAIIKYLENYINKVNKTYEIFKEKNQLGIKLFKEFLDLYVQSKEINFQLIENIKKLEFISFNKVFEDIDSFIEFLNNYFLFKTKKESINKDNILFTNLIEKKYSIVLKKQNLNENGNFKTNNLNDLNSNIKIDNENNENDNENNENNNNNNLDNLNDKKKEEIDKFKNLTIDLNPFLNNNPINENNLNNNLNSNLNKNNIDFKKDKNIDFNLKINNDNTLNFFKKLKSNLFFTAFKNLKNEFHVIYIEYSKNISKLLVYDLYNNKIVKELCNNIKKQIIFSVKHYIYKNDEYLIINALDGTITIFDINLNYLDILIVNIYNNKNIIEKNINFSSCLLLNEQNKFIISSFNGNIIQVYSFDGFSYVANGINHKNITTKIESFHDKNNNNDYIIFIGNDYVISYTFLFNDKKEIKYYQIYKCNLNNNDFLIKDDDLDNIIKIIISSNNEIFIYNFNTAELLNKIKYNEKFYISSLCLWNENILLGGCEDKKIYVFDLKNKTYKSIECSKSKIIRIEKINLKNLGDCLITYSNDGNLIILN